MIGKKSLAHCLQIQALETVWFYKKCRELEMLIFRTEIVLAVQTVICVTELEYSPDCYFCNRTGIFITDT